MNTPSDTGPPCRWCGKSRGVVYIDTPNRGPWGTLFCPCCDFAHAQAAGPPIEHRVRDVWPRP